MDYLVLWLDCDLEGENICFEVCNVASQYSLDCTEHSQVMDEVLPVMRQHHGTQVHPHIIIPHTLTLHTLTPSPQTVFRAKFSSITEPAIMQAFRTLTSPNHNESRSVDARQELDLRIGCSFTRFQTRCFQVRISHAPSVISW